MTAARDALIAMGVKVVYHAPAGTCIYNDHGGDVLCAALLSEEGCVELWATGEGVHIRVEDLEDVCARLRAVAQGRDPEEA